MTKVLKNCDKNRGAGGRVGGNNILTFLILLAGRKMPL